MQPLQSEPRPLRRSGRSQSPVKMETRSNRATNSPTREGARSPEKFSSYGKNPGACRIPYDSNVSNNPQSHSSKENGYNSRKTPDPSAPQSPASRRAHKATLAPIDTEIARRHAKLASQRKHGQGPIIAQRPPEPTSPAVVRFAQDASTSETSSLYSQDRKDELHAGYVSPLRITKDSSPKHLSILKSHNDWRSTPCVPEAYIETPRLGAGHECEQMDASNTSSIGIEPIFSPLGHLALDDPRGIRKTSKTLIGHNGWLESTSKPVHRSPSSPTGKTGFFDNFVKKAKGMMVTRLFTFSRFPDH